MRKAILIILYVIAVDFLLSFILYDIAQEDLTSIYEFTQDTRQFYSQIQVYVEYQEGLNELDYPWVNRAVQTLAPLVPISITQNPTEAEICVIVQHRPLEIYNRSQLQDENEVAVGSSLIRRDPFQIGNNCRARHAVYITTTYNYYPLNVAIHEILHSLGLGIHSDNPHDLMSQHSTSDLLSTNDISRLLALYY